MIKTSRDLTERKQAEQKIWQSANFDLLTGLPNHRVNISGSIGLANFPGAGEAVDELMQNADQAMYAAKEQGGQQIQI